MTVLIDNRQSIVELDEKLEEYINKVVAGVLEYQQIKEEYEISISLVDNEEIKDLNKIYRSIDSPTDVLSFPMLELVDGEEELLDNGEFNEELPLGDIVISIEKAKEQAVEYDHSFERELAFLLVHGMLHLLGFDHIGENDEKIMFEKQENVLKMLNISR